MDTKGVFCRSYSDQITKIGNVMKKSREMVLIKEMLLFRTYQGEPEQSRVCFHGLDHHEAFLWVTGVILQIIFVDIETAYLGQKGHSA